MKNAETDSNILSYAEQLIKMKHKRAKVVRPLCDDQWRIDIQEIFKGNDKITDIRKALNERWNSKWGNMETKRFSTEQQVFFDQLRMMTKYHMFQKAGGGIVTHLMDEGGNINCDIDDINRKISKFLEEIHTAPPQEKIVEDRKWKRLPPLQREETYEIMKSMSTGKAIAFDLIGDEIFKTNYDRKNEMNLETEKRIDLLRYGRDY